MSPSEHLRRTEASCAAVKGKQNGGEDKASALTTTNRRTDFKAITISFVQEKHSRSYLK